MQIVIFRCYSRIHTTPVVVMSFVVRPSAIVAYMDIYYVWLNICDSSYDTAHIINVSLRNHPQVPTCLVLALALCTNFHVLTSALR